MFPTDTVKEQNEANKAKKFVDDRDLELIQNFFPVKDNV